MFAVTIAVGWEFYEFLMDTLHGTNLQLAKAGPETAMFDLAKYHGEYGYIGLVDTMTDMMMNVVGGIVGMIFMIVLRTKGDKKRAAKANKRTAMHTHCGSFSFYPCFTLYSGRCPGSGAFLPAPTAGAPCGAYPGQSSRCAGMGNTFCRHCRSRCRPFVSFSLAPR